MRPTYIYTACLSLMLVSNVGEASRVVKVAQKGSVIVVSQDKDNAWKVGDAGCAQIKQNKFACGRVAKATSKLAIIKVSRPSQHLKVGVDYVQVDARKTASVQTLGSKATIRRYDGYENNLSGGLSAGLNHMYPILEYQRMVGDKLALGISPLLLMASGAGTTFFIWGGFLTANYYFDGAFKNLGVQAGPGVYMISATNGVQSESGMAFAFSATGMYRFNIHDAFNLSLSAGAQFVTPVALNVATLSLQGIQLFGKLEVGYSF